MKIIKQFLISVCLIISLQVSANAGSPIIYRDSVENLADNIYNSIDKKQNMYG